MSNKPYNFQNQLNINTIQIIDDLNLTTIQKHHVRILFHCLVVLKGLSNHKSLSKSEDDLLRDWCKKESEKFNDQKFNNLLYEQISSTSKKLKKFSQEISKPLRRLDIDDLVILVKRGVDNKF